MNRDIVVAEWLDLKALTQYACVSRRTLQSWMNRAHDPLPASRPENKILVNRKDFDRWLEHQSVRRPVDVDSLVSEIVASMKKKAS